MLMGKDSQYICAVNIYIILIDQCDMQTPLFYFLNVSVHILFEALIPRNFTQTIWISPSYSTPLLAAVSTAGSIKCLSLLRQDIEC